MLACCAGVGSATAGTYERLLAGLQSQDVRPPASPSAGWRRSATETLLGDCQAALARVAWRSPTVGLTEDGPTDISAMRREFFQWRLAAIFRDCTELTHDILAAQDAQREIRGWIRLSRLLADEHAIRSLAEMAALPAARHDEAETAIFVDAAHWRTMRNVIFEAMLKLVDEQ